MKKFLVLLFCSILVIAVVASCGQKKTDEGDDMTAGGHADEMADTTRMDEGMMDSVQDMGEEMLDSAEAMGKEVIEDAGGH